tara:strand:+ start:419 stop:721 length:303 start_codon:yes stop_codon:yes gene_type:complete
MKKIFLVTIVLFLIFLTTFIKNSTKELDERIYKSKERISFLKNQQEMLKLEFDYLSSPKRLLMFQNTYFDEELFPIENNSINEIILNNNSYTIRLKSFNE